MGVKIGVGDLEGNVVVELSFRTHPKRILIKATPPNNSQKNFDRFVSCLSLDVFCDNVSLAASFFDFSATLRFACSRLEVFSK